MKQAAILIMLLSMMICSCGRGENPKTVSNSGSGAAVGNTVTESAISGGAVVVENDSNDCQEDEVAPETEDEEQHNIGVRASAGCIGINNNGGCYVAKDNEKKLKFYDMNQNKIGCIRYTRKYTHHAAWSVNKPYIFVNLADEKSINYKMIRLEISSGNTVMFDSPYSEFIFYKNKLYFYGYEGEGIIYVTDINGKKINEINLQNSGEPQLIYDDQIYYTDSMGIRSCDLDGGNDQSVFDCKDEIDIIFSGTFEIDGQYMYFVGSDVKDCIYVFCVDLNTKQLSRASECEASEYAVAENGIYYADLNGMIYEKKRGQKAVEFCQGHKRIYMLYSDGKLFVILRGVSDGIIRYYDKNGKQKELF